MGDVAAEENGLDNSVGEDAWDVKALLDPLEGSYGLAAWSVDFTEVLVSKDDFIDVLVSLEQDGSLREG